MAINNSANVDSRKVMSGKDGALYDGDGKLMSTVESFNVQINVTNGTYQPLGTAQGAEYLQSYAVSLTFSETVINDVMLINILKTLKEGKTPELNFQGYLKGYNDQEQRLVLRNCVPTGSLDLQNVQVGDSVKRNWTFAVNDYPDFLKSLA